MISAECNRNFFLLNQSITQTVDFQKLFNPPLSYIYEVFRVAQQVPLFIEDHLERFFNTTKLSGLEPGVDYDQLLDYIHQVIAVNPPGAGNMKLALYYNQEGSRQLFVYFTPHQYPSQTQFEQGVDVELYFAERENPNAKVMHTVMRKSTDEVKNQHEVYEVLLVDRQGFITEGSRSNVFFIRNNQLITPPADTVLEGITRKQILRLCDLHNIQWIEEKVSHTTLSDFDALFISGTSRRVLPVKKVNEQHFAVSHQLMHQLQLLFEKKVEDYIVLKKNPK
jgi:branched-chain amino acid aminotransferase